MEDARDDRELRGAGTPLPIRCEGGGFAVEGPGFYVWDEDVERVRCVARELYVGRVPQAPTRRLLVVGPQEVEGPPSAPGACRRRST